MKADLHMHSTYSDGGCDPSELMKRCADGGLSIVALTDHDTTGGVEAAAKEAEKLGVTFILGIELSTRVQGKSVDILGYGINPEDEEFQKTIAFYRSMRKSRMDEMLKKCKVEGLDVRWSDVLRYVTGHTYSRPHLAKALVEKGYAKTVKEAFDRYVGEGKPCYVKKEEELTPYEAIDTIHGAGGLAVVAHPIFYRLDDEIKNWVIHGGLDGIEVYHRDHDTDAVDRFKALAKSIENETGTSLLKTGGSDFHHESFGRAGEELGVTNLPYHEAELLLEELQKVR